MKNKISNKGLDIMIPIPLGESWQTKENIINAILEQHTNYGFTRFLLFAPSKGWRSIGYPPQEHFVEIAHLFKAVKENLQPYGVELGWWETLTIKSGATEGFQGIVRAIGERHPFANCPLGKSFQNRFAGDMALFARIAKPAFIFLEDDYSLSAKHGCFCELHLKEFEKRYGYRYSREELAEILEDRTPKALEIINKWRELAKNSMVEVSAAIRRELDKESPEIPVGSMQCNDDFRDGDCTEDICKALAGVSHIPYSRYAGADYEGMKARNIPNMLFRALYSRQHFHHMRHYLEADTYPHTRFFTAGCQILAYMSAGLSCGFDGVIFHTMQQFDNPCEESAYGRAFKQERKRLEEIHQKAKACRIKGVEIKYAPFWYTLNNTEISPWMDCIGRFGIPYTTEKSKVVFWDETLARSSGHEQILEALSGNLFLDGDAARCLCEKGYGEYLGVSVGDDVSLQDNLKWDLGACEVICESFVESLEGRNMYPAWMYSPGGNGVALDLKITNENTQAITQLYSFRKTFLTNGMTYFENDLGGKVIVMGMTLKNNHSQPLFNYRRKYLIQELVRRCSNEFCFVQKAPDVMIIENVNVEQDGMTQADFKEMLTLINLCEDKLDEVWLHIPASLANFSEISILDGEGIWNRAEFLRNGESVILPYRLPYCEPMYLLIK